MWQHYPTKNRTPNQFWLTNMFWQRKKKKNKFVNKNQQDSILHVGGQVVPVMRGRGSGRGVWVRHTFLSQTPTINLVALYLWGSSCGAGDGSPTHWQSLEGGHLHSAISTFGTALGFTNQNTLHLFAGCNLKCGFFSKGKKKNNSATWLEWCITRLCLSVLGSSWARRPGESDDKRTSWKIPCQYCAHWCTLTKEKCKITSFLFFLEFRSWTQTNFCVLGMTSSILKD